MKEKLFQDKYDEIHVPQEDVQKAIRSGIQKASERSEFKKKIGRTRRFIISTAAAFTLLSSSFLVPSVSHVLADVPLVGQLYSNFNDLVGRNLESQQLITQLDKTASYKGIDVTITSAYYDGAVIGVTFDVSGDVKTDQEGRLSAFYEIFNGHESITESKEIVHLESTDKGYTGHVQVSYPKTNLPDTATFPLEFMRIGEEEGVWKFDVPIKQLPYEMITVDKERSNNEANVKVHFDSIIAGKASTAINYTAAFPIEGKHDQVRIEAYDDQGNEINISMDGIDLEKTKKDNQVIVKGRSIIPQELKGKTEFIEIHPKVALSLDDQFVKLDQQTPVDIITSRQNLSVTVEDMVVKGERFVIDFQFNHGDNHNRHLTSFKNFARNDVMLVKESEKNVYQKPIKHSVKVLDKDNLRFRSTFDISDNFNIDDYVIRVNLGILSANMPLELKPVKINLNEQ
ncbi:DUF4179 domain-containing protein [Virgibacillus necropolis]|uniref:DUF4179 domain-containing protein n=1 Tax=Virgibacillus necropolis TaxID=163877 RepID=UPI00384CCD53